MCTIYLKTLDDAINASDSKRLSGAQTTAIPLVSRLSHRGHRNSLAFGTCASGVSQTEWSMRVAPQGRSGGLKTRSTCRNGATKSSQDFRTRQLARPGKETAWTFQLPKKYGCFGFMVVLVVLFVLRYFADFCGRLLVFCARFVLICGRFVGCADLRAFARKTGSITKTTHNFLVVGRSRWRLGERRNGSAKRTEDSK